MKYLLLLLLAPLSLFAQPAPTSTIRVVGAASNGAAPSQNPVWTAGWDGTNVRALRTDSSGNLLVTLTGGGLAAQIQGTQAEGAAATDNPVRVGGWDGTNLRTLRTTSTGVINAGLLATGADSTSNAALSAVANPSGSGPLLVAPVVFNGTTWDRIRGTLTGIYVQGIDSPGATITAQPVLTGGVDGGGAARALLTSTAGRLSVEINSGTTVVTQSTAANLNATVVGTVTANAGTGNFTVVQATPANLQALVTGAAASGTAVSGNPVLIGGSDGTNARTLVTSAAGRLSVDVNSGTLSVTGSGDFTVVQPSAANLNATVVGTVTANAGTGNFTVVQGTAANLQATVVQGTAANLNAQVVGAGASGAPPVGNPVLMAGSDGTNAQTLLTSAAGRLSVEVNSGTVTANAGTGNFTVVQSTASNLNATVAQGTAANLNAQVFGGAAEGAAASGNPVRVGGWDGTNARTLLTSAAGRLSVDVNGGTLSVTGSGTFTVVQPTAANLNATVTGTVTANAGTGNFTVVQATPANLQALVTGAAASGTAASGNPVLTAGSDGTNARTISTDTSGRQIAVGAAASGTAVAGSPVLMGGSDGTNARSLLTSAAGRLSVEVNSGTITANAGTGNFTVVQATPANLQALVTGGAASGSPVSGNPVLMGGSDGTNARSLLTSSAGRLSVEVNSGNITSTISGSVTVAQAVAANLNATVTGTITANAGTGNFANNITQVGGNTVTTGGVSGSLGIGGLAANAAAVAGNPVLMGGSDGTNARSLTTDTGGRLQVIGGAASGAAAAGNPVLVAGVDSSGNVRRPLVTTGGALSTLVAATPGDAAANSAGNLYTDSATNVPLQVFNYSYNGTTWDRSRGNTNGDLVQGSAAAGSAVAGNPVMMGLSDGTNARRVFGNSSGIIGVLQNDGGMGDAMPFNRTARAVDQNGNGSLMGVAPAVFNGATWDLLAGSSSSGVRVGGRGSDLVAVNAPIAVCDQVAVFSVGVSSTSAIVAASGSRRVRVCQVTFGASAAGTFRFISGTGATCGTGTTNVTGQIPIAINDIYQAGSGIGIVMVNTAADAFCIQTASGASGEGYLTYAQY